MHYCGTCKTIGSRYGQRARMLLNHDAAFLGELLSALTGADAEQWPQAYRSWNCMSLPSTREMPLLLRYTAAANVLLGEYKVRDHEEDSRTRRTGRLWNWARRFFSQAFRKAQQDLAEFGFPLRETAAILSRQTALEAIQEVDVELVAHPTAEVTALVFRHGARLAGLDSQADALADTGYCFGRLIYLLDAWQDFDRDVRTGQFNPLRSTAKGRDWAAREIRRSAAEIDVPVEFRARLQANIEASLGSQQFRVLSSCARQTIGMRWREALARTRNWKAPLISFALVVAMAFLFQRQARLAKSARECLSLGMNLMALGGMMAMIAGPVRPKGRIRSCLSSCCCDPGCDCCCEGCCESCGSCCEGAECCGSCCEGCSGCDC
jgi:hypothetical protein